MTINKLLATTYKPYLRALYFAVSLFLSSPRHKFLPLFCLVANYATNSTADRDRHIALSRDVVAGRGPFLHRSLP